MKPKFTPRSPKTYITIYYDMGSAQSVKDSFSSDDVASYEVLEGGALEVTNVKGGVFIYGPSWKWRVSIKADE